MPGPKLSNRTEDIVNESLAHILNSSEASRQALLDVLRGCGADIDPITLVQTQSVVGSGAFPDLTGFDSHGLVRVFIEAKFQATLTKHQPVTYLQDLPDEKPSALLFVVPPERLAEIWEELQGRVAKADNLYLCNEHVEPEIRWGDVGENRKLVLTTWRFLLDGIAAHASSAVAQTVNDIHQIQGVVELRSLDTLRRSPLAPEFPRSIPHLYALVDDAVESMEANSLAELKNYRPSVTSGYSVRYFTFCGLKNCSFGIYFRNWRTYHHDPLAFTLHKEDLNQCAVQALGQAPFHGYTINEGSSHLYIPIHLLGGEYQAVLDSIVWQTERIAAVIKPELGQH